MCGCVFLHILRPICFFLPQSFLATVTESNVLEDRWQFTGGAFNDAKLQSRADKGGTLDGSDVHRCSGDAAVVRCLQRMYVCGHATLKTTYG